MVKTTAFSKVSSAFPFKSKFVEVLGAKLHYIEKGKGVPLLFLHGIPASSYVWRNIIPKLSDQFRCIAPDLIGMGKSEKPDINYNISNHIKYIENFINVLGLKNIILVLHGLGSIIGFDYAMRHSKNIRGIIFYESYIGYPRDMKLSLPLQHLNALLRKRETGHNTVMTSKDLIKKILDTTSIRKLTTKELLMYSSTFNNTAGRKILWQYIQESPFGTKNKNALQRVEKYTTHLEKSQIPKLLLYTIPGFITSIDNVIWCRDHLPNITLIDIGQGLHFVQEHNPQGFSSAIKNWAIKEDLLLH